MFKKVFIKKVLFVILTLVIFLSCSKNMTVSLSVEKENIIKLHNLQRDYHFNKDSVAFVNQLSDNFISVNKGKITYPKREETLSRYHRYFSSVEFVKWDDMTPPIIKFSDDGSLAYCIIDKIVELTFLDSNKKKVEQKTHFAWTSIYKKYGDEWKIDCVISTEKP